MTPGPEEEQGGGDPRKKIENIIRRGEIRETRSGAINHSTLLRRSSPPAPSNFLRVKAKAKRRCFFLLSYRRRDLACK